jgi:hypothetical protein
MRLQDLPGVYSYAAGTGPRRKERQGSTERRTVTKKRTLTQIRKGESNFHESYESESESKKVIFGGPAFEKRCSRSDAGDHLTKGESSGS